MAIDYGNSRVDYSVPGPGGFTTVGGGQTGAENFLNALFTARPQFIQQQGQLLSGLGPSLRNALFGAIPELASLSGYLQERFQQPIPRSLEKDFAARLRTAQVSRGFSGGQGPAAEEAKFLTALSEQARQQLVPAIAGFGQQILGNIGLAGPPNLELGTLGALMLQYRDQLANQSAFNQSQQLAQQLLGSRGGSASVGSGGAGGAYASGFYGGSGLGGVGSGQAFGFSPPQAPPTGGGLTYSSVTRTPSAPAPVPGPSNVLGPFQVQGPNPNLVPGAAVGGGSRIFDPSGAEPQSFVPRDDYQEFLRAQQTGAAFTPFYAGTR